MSENINITGANIVDETKVKINALKKYKNTDEFKLLVDRCNDTAEEKEREILEILEERKYNNHNKIEPHKAIYSELDKMLLSLYHLETLQIFSNNEAFLKEINEKLTNIKSHLLLRGENFDFCIYSKLDYIKEEYKLALSFEGMVDDIISGYETVVTKFDVNPTINPYTDNGKTIEERISEITKPINN